MPQAENVISFPVNAATTDFLHDFIASPEGRLGEVAARLDGIAAALFVTRKFIEDAEPLAAATLGLLETTALDCIRILELRPVSEVAEPSAVEQPA